MVLEKDRIYFGTGQDCPFFIDPYTGARRATVFNDVVSAAWVVYALPNLDFFMSLGLVSEVPRESYDRPPAPGNDHGLHQTNVDHSSRRARSERPAQNGLRYLRR